MSIQATIIIPTFDHGPTLLRSVPSALRQTLRDIEVFVIGDGVPDATRQIMVELMRADDRVRFFDHPKHESRAEPYRHAAINAAQGRVICYLSDDDLYLPHHVETMVSMLGNNDFVHAVPIHVTADGRLGTWTVDLSLSEHQRLIAEVENRIPLSAGAHTREAYDRLPHGWMTPPAGVPSDLFMWRQFLADSRCRFSSASLPTMLVFPSPMRRGWTSDQRVEELDQWCQKMAHPGGYESLVTKLLDQKIREATVFDANRCELRRELAAKRTEASECQRALAEVRRELELLGRRPESAALWTVAQCRKAYDALRRLAA